MPTPKTKFPPSVRRGFRLPLPVMLATFGWACIDDDPTEPGARDPNAGEAAEGLDAWLGEDAHMLDLAREIPGFGGYYYEPGGGRRLVVALTEADAGGFPAAREAVSARLAADVTRAASGVPVAEAPRPEFVKRVVEHSFIELARHRARLRPHVFAVPEVVSLAVDEELNRVVIGLEDPSAKAAVMALVNELAVPADMISFSQTSAVRMGNRYSGESPPHPSLSEGAGTLRLDGPTADGKLRAGYQVQAEGGKICTLGFTAVLDNGALVFVSNSHCSKIPWRPDFGEWGQPDTSNMVGVEVSDPRPRRCWKGMRRVDCRNSDASMMAVDTDVSIALAEIGRTEKRHRVCNRKFHDPFVDYCSTIVDSLSPVIYISNTRSRSEKNDVLDKVGITTGWTWGYVKETCEDVRGDTNVVVLCADIVDFRIAYGDSGGPVFRYSNSEFRGIVFGMRDRIPNSGWDGDLYREGVFQDLRGIEVDLPGGLNVLDEHWGVSVNIVGHRQVPPDEVCIWTAYARGIEPFRYEWSGVLHGSDRKVSGVVEESGWLKVEVTDPLDRTARDSMEVMVNPSSTCKTPPPPPDDVDVDTLRRS